MKPLITGTEGYISARMPVVPFTCIRDLCHAERSDFEGIDAVVHLAELSNDPLGQNLAKFARAAGVRGFVYANEFRAFTRLEELKYLSRTGRIDALSAAESRA